MIKKAALALCGALAVAASNAMAAGPEPLVLQPSSVWGVNYATDSCELSRTFGTGGDEFTLELQQFAPGRKFALLVAATSLKASGNTEAIATSFEPNGRRLEDNQAFVRKLPDGRTVIETGTGLFPTPYDGSTDWKVLVEEDAKPSAYDPEGEAKITSLRLSRVRQRDIVLELGPMDRPMSAIRACLDDLLTHWGIDPAVDRSLTRRAAPRGNPGPWATPNDYPPQALMKHESAIVHFRLMVDTAGKPTGCTVQASGDAAFDKITCDLMMRRATFNPALDAAGKPVPSYYVNSVRWLIPG